MTEIKQDLEQEILKLALQNALKYEGKANPSSLAGRLLSVYAEYRAKKDDLMKIINKVADKVNRMPIKEQEILLKEIAPETAKTEEHNKINAKDKSEHKEKKELPKLKNAQIGNVITRMPPEPSKYNHIGHAMSFLLNYLYAKKYEGKCILRFDDTNPEKSKQEYVDAMIEDCCNYLELKPDKIIFASDEMEKFYKSAEDLIEREEAYVCFCEQEKMRENRHNGTECEHRKQSKTVAKKHWDNMTNGSYNHGECVLRLKIDMQSPNHVMRDPVIFRVSNAVHYRQKLKYKAWPMYDFESPLEDEWCNISHVLRSNEFGEMRIELQKYLLGLFGYKEPEVKQYGRVTVRGATTQGREIREGIANGTYTGWDDVRLVTLKSLRRRGIQKETFYDLALEVGLSPTQTPVDWTLISSLNRKYLDERCNRHFFVAEPVEIVVENAPDLDIELNLHPHHRKGGRKFMTAGRFIVSKTDFNDFRKGEIIRLMDCLNFVTDIDANGKKRFLFHSRTHKEWKEYKGKKIIHYLPLNELNVRTKILMPDATYAEGYAEPLVRNLKIGEIIQFERFGFCVKEKEQFVYSHK